MSKSKKYSFISKGRKSKGSQGTALIHITYDEPIAIGNNELMTEKIIFSSNGFISSKIEVVDENRKRLDKL